MIPNTIYYGWFGKNSLTPLALSCIESWKKFCPSYNIVELNENNIDIEFCNYVKSAYYLKKWAYVWDYARMYAMYNYGGITLDCDVELLKPLDRFLIHTAFTGREVPSKVGTAVMGTEKFHWFGKEMLDYYKTAKINLRLTNINIMTDLFKNNIRDLVLYEKTYFCPNNWHEPKNRNKITENTYAIHWFAGSWK